jgi:hypothetical protein
VQPLPPERTTRIEELADELARVEWETPSGVDEIAFHALGLRHTRGPGPLATAFDGRRHLVVSPFLDDAGVTTALGSGTEATLISRPEALDKLDPKTVDGLDCRVLSPMAGLEQPDESDDEAVQEAAAGPATAEPPSDQSRLSLLGGLHAKLYVVEAGWQAHMLLGGPPTPPAPVWTTGTSSSWSLGVEGAVGRGSAVHGDAVGLAQSDVAGGSYVDELVGDEVEGRRRPGRGTAPL